MCLSRIFLCLHFSSIFLKADLFLVCLTQERPLFWPKGWYYNIQPHSWNIFFSNLLTVWILNNFIVTCFLTLWIIFGTLKWFCDRLTGLGYSLEGSITLYYFKNVLFQPEGVFLVLFNVVFFLRITTLLTWLESTLLLKINALIQLFIWKHNVLQTNETQHYCRKERCLRSGVRKRKGSVN